MSDSATTRERRKLRTAEQLTAVSRRLTAERGLGGFTVEEVCDEVGVSRRTFFNYFPSKEDAVLGVDEHDETRRFAADFLARGSHGWDAVVDDLVELMIVHFESTDMDRASHTQFIAAIEREPRLLSRLVGLTRDRERQAAELVAEREGVTPDDPRAEIAVGILSALLRTAGERYLRSPHDRSFGTILVESLGALRTVLVPSSPRTPPIRTSATTPSPTRKGPL